jgi:hypothetical protein
MSTKQLNMVELCPDSCGENSHTDERHRQNRVVQKEDSVPACVAPHITMSTKGSEAPYGARDCVVQ